MWQTLLPLGANLISGLLGSKKAKAPEYKQPREIGLGDLPHYESLKDFADKRIKGQDVGFGDSFVDKASNPAISNLENSFQKKTMPFLSSELSKRGIARSAGPGLATDVLGQAENQKNLDVNELISKFYTLNEQQKKRDITEGVGVAERQRGLAANLVGQNNANVQNENQFALQSYPIEATRQASDNLFGLETADPVVRRLIEQATGNKNATQTRTLNNDDYDKLAQIIKQLGGQ